MFFCASPTKSCRKSSNKWLQRWGDEAVAGATICALGCNGPEMFTNLISLYTGSDAGRKFEHMFSKCKNSEMDPNTKTPNTGINDFNGFSIWILFTIIQFYPGILCQVVRDWCCGGLRNLQPVDHRWLDHLGRTGGAPGIGTGALCPRLPPGLKFDDRIFLVMFGGKPWETRETKCFVFFGKSVLLSLFPTFASFQIPIRFLFFGRLDPAGFFYALSIALLYWALLDHAIATRILSQLLQVPIGKL